MLKKNNYGLSINQHRYIKSDSLLNCKKSFTKKNKALIFDRDGVIIKEENYIKDPRKVSLEIGVYKLINTASRLDWKIVIVTNQSGIFRGYFGWKDYEKVTEIMIKMSGKSCPIDAIYANGEGPNSLITSWRKPSPEMIKQATEDLQLDLSKSIMFGDRLSDLVSGENAGVGRLIHLETGHGLKEKELIKTKLLQINNKIESQDNSLKLKKAIPKVIFLRSLKEFNYNYLY